MYLLYEALFPQAGRFILPHCPDSDSAVSSPRLPSSLLIALTGLLSLSIAMGIGRFAFTPVLPMMLHDGTLDLPTGSWLATANYIGYLLGALLCAASPFWQRYWRGAAWPPARLVHTGLAATVALTLAMALPWPDAWPTWRFLSGIASAVVFVFTSGWVMAQLAQRQSTHLGSMIFAGPGAGIALSGLAVMGMVQQHWLASSAWIAFGLLALLLTLAVWRTLDSPMPNAVCPPASLSASSPTESAAPSTPPTVPPEDNTGGTLEIGLLAVAYGLAGFGYIISATFLPVIARTVLPPSPWLDMFWPIFGISVSVGALLATQAPRTLDNRLALLVNYLLQAAGVLLSIFWQTLPGFVLSSILLGLPFTSITFFALQEVRRLRPGQTASLLALITALYGIGQIAGPPLAAALVERTGDLARGFDLALGAAAATLLIGAGLYWLMFRRWPTTPKHPTP